MDNKNKDSQFVWASYLPYLGFFASLYFILTEKKNSNDPEDVKKIKNYCRFHSYHGLFLWIAVFLVFFIIKFLAFWVTSFPLLGGLLSHLLIIISYLLHVVVIFAGCYFTYKTYQGLPFNIPFLTEYVNNFMENKKMLT